MNPVKEAAAAINELLKLVGEEPIPIPTVGSNKEKLDAIFEIYTDRLIAMNPKYKKFKNKRDIADLGVMYLNKVIEEQEKK